MDIDNVPFGIDFRDHIKGALLASDVVIVIIGPKWLGPGKGGRLRIKDETDPVRIEVETALQKGVPLIPVLVNGATMPTPAELPDTLKDFAFRNAAEVETGRDFNQHMDRLIRALVPIIPGLQSPEPRPERQTLTPGAIAGERNLIKVTAPATPPPAERTAHGEPHRQRTTLIALASAGVAAAVV